MMKRKLTSFLLLLALIVAGTSSLVSCKDYDSDVSADLRNQLADIVQKQAQEIQNLSQQIDQRIQNATSEDGIISNYVNNYVITEVTNIANAKAQDAENNAKNYTDQQLISVNQQLRDITAQLAEITQLRSDLNDLTSKLNDLNDKYSTLTDKTNQMSDSLAHVWALAHTDSIRIDALEDSINKHRGDITKLREDMNAINELNNTKFQELKDSVNKHYNDIKDLKGAVANAQSTAVQALAEVNSLRNEYQTYVTTAINTLKQELDNKYASKDDLKNYLTGAEIKELYYDKTDIDTKMENLETKLTALINQLSDYVNSLITGIVIQATDNPVAGYANTPADVQLNMLAAYYGYADKGFNFPNASAANYFNEEEYVALPAAEGHITIGGGDEMLSDNGANAGTVYVTLNSVDNDRDMSGVTVTLEASDGSAAPGFAPLTLAKSDRKLTFGYSRAANNGFYAANANVTDPQAAKLDVDAAALKAAGKNVLDKLTAPGKNRLNIADIATTLYKNFNNKLVAYGVKSSWTDAKGKEHAVYSKYNMAAFAIKPLSYKFLYNNSRLQNLDLPRIPTIQSKLQFDDYYFNWTPIEGLSDVSTSITLKDIPDLTTIKIDGKIVPPADLVTIIGKDGIKGTVNSDNSITIDASSLGVEIGDINVGDQVKISYDKNDQTYDVTIPMDEFNRVINDLNNEVAGKFDKINSIIDQIRGYSETIDGKYISRINSYIQKFERLLRKSNTILQPMVMYPAANGSWNQLSREQHAASLMKLDGQSEGAITLVPTSYCAEILAPAYKKFMTVTSAPSEAAKAFANSGVNMNKVIDGSVHKVMFKANQAGTYEITYSAVDYSGYVTTKKFYVKVSK